MQQRNVTAITPFKVIQGYRFGTNRKLIYDFLLVINRPTNLPSILHRFEVMIIGQIFVSERGVPHFNAVAGDDHLQYRHK